MNDGLFERTHEIISRDRSETLRRRADDCNSFCIFASVYEVATELGHSLPKRATQVWKEWQALDESGLTNNGAVSPENAFLLVSILAERFGLEIKKVMGNRSFLDKVSLPGRVVDDKPDETKIEGKDAEKRYCITRSLLSNLAP